MAPESAAVEVGAGIPASPVRPPATAVVSKVAARDELEDDVEVLRVVSDSDDESDVVKMLEEFEKGDRMLVLLKSPVEEVELKVPVVGNGNAPEGLDVTVSGG